MPAMTLDLNPRYLAYMRANLIEDSNLMLALDMERWPGGYMCGFLLWNASLIRQYLALRFPCGTHGKRDRHLAFMSVAADYDAWLAAMFPPLAP